jgi:hypothetical protein
VERPQLWLAREPTASASDALVLQGSKLSFESAAVAREAANAVDEPLP